jgi:hypothetical protein
MQTDAIHEAAERLVDRIGERIGGVHVATASYETLRDAVLEFALAAAMKEEPKPWPFEIDPELRAAFNDPKFAATFEPMRTKAVLSSEWEKLQAQLTAANDLLRRCRQSGLGDHLLTDVNAHLSGQPTGISQGSAAELAEAAESARNVLTMCSVFPRIVDALNDALARPDVAAHLQRQEADDEA